MQNSQITAAMQVFRLEAVAGLSQLRAGTGGTVHWLCKFQQQMSDTGSSRHTKPGSLLACLFWWVGRGDLDDRKRFSAFVKSPFRIIPYIFKDTFTIHVHRDDVDTTEENPERFNRALCSATDTGILDSKYCLD